MSKIKRGMRYHNADEDLIKIGINNKMVNAIIVNESHTGIACVYVGEALNLNDELVWHEAENIRTNCTVVRCDNLKENVVFLAFEF